MKNLTNSSPLRIFSLLILAFLYACSAVKAPHTPAPPPPNVVIIFIDDLGYGDPVCYGGGPYKTPHIDALAASGMRFTNYYAAQAVCTASRAALLTGCYPTRLGIHGAINHQSNFVLNPDEQTLAELFKSKGYHTGIFGKWHLGDRQPFLPLQHGFDEYLGLPYSNDMWPIDFDGYPITDRSNWKSGYPPLPLIEGNTTVKIIKDFNDQDSLTTLFTKRAVQFMEKQKDTPFFLYLPHSMVHVPLGVSSLYRDKSGAGFFGDVMEEIDWSVGEIVNTLKKNNLLENTLVIFSSDNGPWLTFGNHAGNTAGLREGKGTAFDGGLKVPFIASWPNKIPSGTVTNRLMAAMDVLPTVVDICQLPSPNLKIDGVSFKPVLFGDETLSPRDEFVYYYDRNNLKAIRKGEWKLVFKSYSQTYGPPATIGRNRHPGKYGQIEVPLSLFNLSTDPGEDRDVQNLYPEKVEELSKAAEKYRRQMGDGLTNTIGSEVRPAATVNQPKK